MGNRRSVTGGSGRPRLRLSRPGRHAIVAAAGVAFVVLTTLLALLLAELHDSGEHIESQDAKISAVYDAVQPLLDDDTAGQVPPLLETSTRVADQIPPLLDRITPVVVAIGRAVAVFLDELPLRPAAAALTAALDALPATEDAVLRIASEFIPLLSELDPEQAALALSALNSVAAQLLSGDRMTRVIDAASQVLADVRSRDLVSRAARSTERVQKILVIQRRLIELQRQALAIQRQSLSIQAQSLEHIESIDAKTGGEVVPSP